LGSGSSGCGRITSASSIHCPENTPQCELCDPIEAARSGLVIPAILSFDLNLHGQTYSVSTDQHKTFRIHQAPCAGCAALGEIAESFLRANLLLQVLTMAQQRKSHGRL
jgi:hypothetical protein